LKAYFLIIKKTNPVTRYGLVFGKLKLPPQIIQFS